MKIIKFICFGIMLFFPLFVFGNSTFIFPKDCEYVGNWDESTKTCVLNKNVEGEIKITIDEFHLNCAGQKIIGKGEGIGILLEERKNVEIKNCIIENFKSGIRVTPNSHSNKILNNILKNNKEVGVEINGQDPYGFQIRPTKNLILKNEISGKSLGILLFNTSDNEISENLITSGNTGISLSYTGRNKITKNVIQENKFSAIHGVQYAFSNYIENNQIINNGRYGVYFQFKSNENKINQNLIKNQLYGIFLECSSNTEVSNNIFEENGLAVWSSFQNQIKENKVNEKPLIYLEEEKGRKISNAGQVILVKSEGITIEDSVFSKVTFGVEVWESKEIKILKNEFSENVIGIVVEKSSNNTIQKNSFSFNKTGISFVESSNNKIFHNNFKNNKEQVRIIDSQNNFFDNGYPIGGNYWSDYDTPAEGCINNNGDSFCDSPYKFAGGQDNYPFFKENEWEGQKVLISELYYDVAKDRGEEGENEWIIIHNLESQKIDLSNWKICSLNKNKEEKCNELRGEILAKSFAIITPASTTFAFWKIPREMMKIVLNKKFGSYGLNNEGDNIILKNNEGKIVDALSYGKDNSIFDPPSLDVPEGKSLLRFPPEIDTDSASDFIESEPTIGKNLKPNSIINFFPKNPIKGTKVTFDGSFSTDLDGKILKFEWQIGNSIFEGTTTSFSFPENGKYEITLTVTDDDGATSSTSTILKVQPFSFAIITDLHIGRHYREEYQGQDYYLTERLKNVVSWINKNKDKIKCENEICPLRFLAILGDITENTPISGFCKAKEILDNLEIPYVVVFGNHDVGTDKEYQQCSRWKGQDYFDQVFWSTSSIPCPNASSTKNFEILLKEFNFERDEKNKDYKNFAFSFGGINFIGLDFVSREKFMKIGPGVGSDAILNEINENWLKQKLEEFKEGPIILLAHHPFKGEAIPYEAFDLIEISKIRELLSPYSVFLNLGGHIHSFEEIHGKLAPANANIVYSSINNTWVLTTEGLMVGSNGRGVEKETEENGVYNGKKGIIRIVQILGKESYEIKFNNWETTILPEEIRTEFLALNPVIKEIEYEKLCTDKACMEFESQFFTKKDFIGCWQIGDSSIGCGNQINLQTLDSKIKCSGSQSKLKCAFLEAPTTTKVTLIASSLNNSFLEKISKTIEIKLGIIPKIIKIGEGKIEQILMKSFTTGRNLLEKGRSFKDKVIAFIKHSQEIPVAIFDVNFDQAKDDIDLSQLMINLDHFKKKAILYMENWPKEIERSKVLFLPIK